MQYSRVVTCSDSKMLTFFLYLQVLLSANCPKTDVYIFIRFIAKIAGNLFLVSAKTLLLNKFYSKCVL